MIRFYAVVALAFVGLLPAISITQAQSLTLLWIDPQQGPMCAGPLGPGPCVQVGQWLAQHGMLAPGMPALPLTPSIANIDPLAAVSAAQSVSGAIDCAQLTGQDQQPDVDKFLVCTRGALVLNHDSAALVSCVEQAGGSTSQLAACAGSGIIGSKLSRDQRKLLDCATKMSDDEDSFAGCIAHGLIGDQLNDQQRAVLGCVQNNNVSSDEFAGCAGEAMFGDRLSPTARAAIECAAQSQGDAESFGGCAATKFLHLDLNAEQQIGVQCVMTSGGQPYVAAGCAASRLMFRELTKCSEGGFGGEGCFGDNNELIGRKGFVVRNIAGLAGGKNSMIQDPGQILGPPNSVFNYPHQLLGGPNSVPNQLLRNVPSPPPIQVGKIGNHRVCIPWC